MKKLYTSVFMVFFLFAAALAQDRMLEAESAVKTNNTVTVKNKVIPYSATAGTQPVWDKDGKVIASLFYTYYKRF